MHSPFKAQLKTQRPPLRPLLLRIPVALMGRALMGSPPFNSARFCTGQGQLHLDGSSHMCYCCPHRMPRAECGEAQAPAASWSSTPGARHPHTDADPPALLRDSIGVRGAPLRTFYKPCLKTPQLLTPALFSENETQKGACSFLSRVLGPPAAVPALKRSPGFTSDLLNKNLWGRLGGSVG